MSEYGLSSLFDSQEEESSKYANCSTNAKEQHEEVAMQQEPQQQKALVMMEQESWLITPLPSLVSLQTSQKSFIENAPLENLLIEHPSMSVFITQDEINEAEEETFKDTSFALIENKVIIFFCQ